MVVLSDYVEALKMIGRKLRFREHGMIPIATTEQIGHQIENFFFAQCIEQTFGHHGGCRCLHLFDLLHVYAGEFVGVQHIGVDLERVTREVHDAAHDDLAVGREDVDLGELVAFAGREIVAVVRGAHLVGGETSLAEARGMLAFTLPSSFARTTLSWSRTSALRRCSKTRLF